MEPVKDGVKLTREACRVERRAGGLLPPQEESDVERGAVQVDKLEEEHLESEAVLPLGLGPWVL